MEDGRYAAQVKGWVFWYWLSCSDEWLIVTQDIKNSVIFTPSYREAKARTSRYLERERDRKAAKKYLVIEEFTIDD